MASTNKIAFYKYLIKYRLHTCQVLLFYILAVSSIYMGLLISLHLFWYPTWEMISITNLEDNFNQPVLHAVKTFKPLVVILNICALILIPLAKPRLLFVLLFIFILTFTGISIKYILPLNHTLANLNDEKIISQNLILWMKYNDYRMGIIVATWLLTLYLINRIK